ncbi:hypothetical protein GCM10027406_03940 [Leifsonia lichenia]
MGDAAPAPALLGAARETALRAAREAVDSPVDRLPHRELMRRVKTLVSVAIVSGHPTHETVDTLGALLGELRRLQTPTGLFEGGDNVQSPPDSAFTINDACDVHHLLRDAVDPSLAEVRDALATLIRNATPPLLAGGVHTPNHRWEISAALARIHRSFPDARLVGRVDEWLAEGVDIDEDGYYSERSPNYASAVSNPSLLAIAEILDRPELRRVVERNLELTLALIHSDRTVETLPSRRQDQGARFPLAPYAVPFRSHSLSTGRGDFAWAAELAVADGVGDPGVLAELLLHPSLSDPLPGAAAPRREGTTVHPGVSLALRRGVSADTVVYGGSDYGRHGRIRSGLANDPTFLRLFAGDAVLDSVRLSRTFFGLGPFRADAFRTLADGRIELRERVSARYYQPLAPDARRAGADYAVTDDGRFAAAMAFPERTADEVALETTILVVLHDDGADLEVTIDGPPSPWTLELGFRDGGTVDAPQRDHDGAHILGARILGAHILGAHILGARRARYTRCGDAITVELDGIDPDADPAPYWPGEDYAFLSGTDAVGGVRLLVGGTTPTRFVVRLRAGAADA